jgi:wyosine [tRNA(Phe)-imidazoG37] synthetase (radical SAM superfamily)
MTTPLQHGLVYGPIASRRLGRSLGVNVLPDGSKHCNFNCPYCQYGWTPAGSQTSAAWPDPLDVAAAVSAALAADPGMDRITLAGNGEPTLHPAFPQIVDGLRAVRDARAPGAKLAVLSNASTLDHPGIADALGRLDERYMKLDAGDDGTLRQMNASPVPVARIVEGLRRVNGVVLQSMFARGGRIDNTTPAALDAWLDAVCRVRPLGVHVYTIDRDPAWRGLQRVARAELDAIAARVEDLGVPAVVF